MSRYKQYPRYKDSGVKWLGRVPEHWLVKPLRWIGTYQNSNVDKKSYEDQQTVRLCNYTDVYRNEFIRNSMEFMFATASEDEIKTMTLTKGDIVITKDSEDPSDIGIPALVVEDLENVICGYHLTIIKALGECEGFLHRAIQSTATKAHFRVESPGITRFGLSQNAIGGLHIALPTIEEEQTIAAYLDRETTRIDALVNAKTRFIELLREKRQALITHAVTKGLDPNVKMKDSGVEWIGQVPATWSKIRLKYLFTEKKKLNAPNLPCGAISFGNVVYKDSESIPSETRATYQEVLRGEFLINPINLNYDLKSLRTALSEISACVSPAYIVLHANDDSEKNFLKYLFYCFDILHMKTLGAGVRQTITFNDIGGCYVCIPSLCEQRTIAAYLDRETARIEALIGKTELSIELLKERRSALITAAVTGQIDLREVEE